MYDWPCLASVKLSMAKLVTTSGKYHTSSKAGAQTWSSSHESETLTRDFIKDLARTVTIVNEHGDEEVAQVLCPAILPFPVLLTAASIWCRCWRRQIIFMACSRRCASLQDEPFLCSMRTGGHE